MFYQLNLNEIFSTDVWVHNILWIMFTQLPFKPENISLTPSLILFLYCHFFTLCCFSGLLLLAFAYFFCIISRLYELFMLKCRRNKNYKSNVIYCIFFFMVFASVSLKLFIRLIYYLVLQTPWKAHVMVKRRAKHTFLKPRKIPNYPKGGGGL